MTLTITEAQIVLVVLEGLLDIERRDGTRLDPENVRDAAHFLRELAHKQLMAGLTDDELDVALDRFYGAAR